MDKASEAMKSNKLQWVSTQPKKELPDSMIFVSGSAAYTENPTRIRSEQRKMFFNEMVSLMLIMFYMVQLSNVIIF